MFFDMSQVAKLQIVFSFICIFFYLVQVQVIVAIILSRREKFAVTLTLSSVAIINKLVKQYAYIMQNDCNYINMLYMHSICCTPGKHYNGMLTS